MSTRTGLFFQKIKNSFNSRKAQIGRFVDKNPLRSFYLSLAALLVLIVASNVLFKPKPAEETPQLPPKEVSVYSVGKAPRIQVLGKVEKSGVITLTALTPGVVSKINKPVGSEVRRGEVAVSLASNYQGGNAATLQKSLAGLQYKNVQETYDLQKEIISKQRELAQKGDVQADDLRSITDQSLSETRSLIDLNSEILDAIDQNIADLESSNVGGANDNLILSTKQLKSQFLAGTNAAKQGLRMAEYSAASDKAPAQMSDLNKDMTLKQLELQEKMLDLNRDISAVQLKLAKVAEGMMFPSAPFGGVIERVLVKKGQMVTPGTPLAVLTGDGKKQTAMVSAFVAGDMARTISRLEESKIYLSNNDSFMAEPTYVSQEPVQGNLHGVYFTIPEQYTDKVTENALITIELPVGYYQTSASVPFVPIDAIYQTKEKNYLFIVENETAQSREVELGQVLGGLVEITSGLDKTAKVILDRTVITGDKVTEIK